MEVKIINLKTGKKFPLLVEDNGLPVIPVQKYIKSIALQNYSFNTQKNAAFRLKIYFEWLEMNNLTYLEAVHDKDATHKGAYETLADFKLYLKYPELKNNIRPIQISQKRKSSSINQIMTTVSMFYRFVALNDGINELPIYMKLSTNATTHSFINELFLKKEHKIVNILLEKTPAPNPKSVSLKEYELCVQKCTNRRNKIIIGLMYEGGLRKSEVIGLMLSDLKDIADCAIYIRKHDDPNNMTFLKNNSAGVTYISERLRDEIITYINHDLIDVDTNYLIVNFKKGSSQYKPMTSNGIDEILKILSKRTGLQLTAHKFRHGCAMNMARSGMSLSDIQEKLRHKHFETTQNIYITYMSEDKKAIESKYNTQLNNIKDSDDETLSDIIDALLGEDDD